MDRQAIHDLAVAYAQVKLFCFQQSQSDKTGTDEEIREYVKAYTNAILKIPEEENSFDVSTLL